MEQYNNKAPLTPADSIQYPICTRENVSEISGDFTLPDYQPDIKRLIKIGTNVQIPARYVGDARIEFSGSIDYFVTYAGSDGEVYCIPLSSDYSLLCPLDNREDYDFGDGSVFFCKCTADDVTGKVLGPKKINIRCRLKSRTDVFGMRNLNCKMLGEDEKNSIERLNKTVSTAELLHTVSETSRLCDNVIPDSSLGDLRVICAEGSVFITDVTPSVGSAAVRGDMNVKLLLCRENNGDEKSLPFVMNRKIPFSVTVDMPMLSSDCKVCAVGKCADISVEVGGDDENAADYRSNAMKIDCGLILEVFGTRNKDTLLCLDMFSTAYESDLVCEDMTLPRLMTAGNGNFTLERSVLLDETSIPSGSRVIDSSAVAEFENVSFDRGRFIIGGNAHFNVMCEKDGDISTFDIPVPFKYETDAPNTPHDFDKLHCTAYFNITNTRARTDSERIALDAEVCLLYMIFEDTTVSVPSSCELYSGIPRKRGEYVVCYPAPTESVWSVAKRYHTPVAKLAEINSLPVLAPEAEDTPESLGGIKFLIVR